MSRLTLVAIVAGLLAGACARGSLTVTDARVPQPAGANAAVYFQLDNNSDHDVALVGAESDIAVAEIHQTTMTGGMMQMAPVDRIAIAPGETVEFAPGGLHIMLVDVPVLNLGQKVKITLEFDDGSRVVFTAEVSPIETP